MLVTIYHVSHNPSCWSQLPTVAKVGIRDQVSEGLICGAFEFISSLSADCYTEI